MSVLFRPIAWNIEHLNQVLAHKGIQKILAEHLTALPWSSFKSHLHSFQYLELILTSQIWFICYKKSVAVSILSPLPTAALTLRRQTGSSKRSQL